MKKSLFLGGAVAMFATVQAAQAAIVSYDVVETFYESMTQPNDTIFTGSFQFDTDTLIVSNLSGTITQSMTGMAAGEEMSEVTLSHQLSSVYDAALGGLLVTTFKNSNTNTLYNGLGGDGWAPGSGMAMHYNWPGENPNNAYAMIFVNISDPTAALTQAQIDKLAYADCTPDGMMGSVCMAGTTVAGYGILGSMDGYPVSQVITASAVSPVPVPGALVLMMSGLLGLFGFSSHRRGNARSNSVAS
jgi:hypothetical protein